LQILRNKAEHCEQQILQIYKIVTLGAVTRPASSASLFVAGSTQDYSIALEQQINDTSSVVAFESIDIDDYYVPSFLSGLSEASAFVSQAEADLRQASGEQNLVECWGCKDVPRFHNKRFHRYRNCPHRDDPEVRNKAMERARQWRENRNGQFNSTLSPNALSSDWEQLGFSSRNEADTIFKLMSTLTSKGERQELCRTLQSTKRALMSPTDDEPLSKHARDDSDTTVLAMSAMPNVPQCRFPFNMTGKLPTIRIPVGEAQDKLALRGLPATCASISLGYLPYHQAVARSYPQAVAQYVVLAQADYREEQIGGVHGERASVIVTAAIRYLLPYQVQGSRATLVVALSNQLAANTIFGLTFQKRSKFIINLSNDSIHSEVFGDSYIVEYEVPTRDEVPSLQDSSPNAQGSAGMNTEQNETVPTPTIKTAKQAEILTRSS
jgi:hypothetical protein